MRVLVTGGAGLVGMDLRQTLPAAGHEVTATDLTTFGRSDPTLVLMPLSDAAGFDRLIADRGIEAIVHSGGISGPAIARDRPAHIAEVNIGSTAMLLDVARRRGLARFLLMSSHVVYGDCGHALIDEDRTLRPGTTYAASKVGGEALVQSFRAEFGLSAASLRLTRLYGAYRRANCPLRQAILDSANGTTTVIPCDPGFIYHYLYVRDVSAAVAACLGAKTLNHAAYNVTSGERLTMPETAAIVSRVLLGARIELIDGVDGAPDIQDDFTRDRLTADIGWTAAWPLERGFADYVATLKNDPTAACT